MIQLGRHRPSLPFRAFMQQRTCPIKPAGAKPSSCFILAASTCWQEDFSQVGGSASGACADACRSPFGRAIKKVASDSYANRARALHGAGSMTVPGCLKRPLSHVNPKDVKQALLEVIMPELGSMKRTHRKLTDQFPK